MPLSRVRRLTWLATEYHLRRPGSKLYSTIDSLSRIDVIRAEGVSKRFPENLLVHLGQLGAHSAIKCGGKSDEKRKRSFGWLERDMAPRKE